MTGFGQPANAVQGGDRAWRRLSTLAWAATRTPDDRSVGRDMLALCKQLKGAPFTRQASGKLAGDCLVMAASAYANANSIERVNMAELVVACTKAVDASLPQLKAHWTDHDA